MLTAIELSSRASAVMAPKAPKAGGMSLPWLSKHWRPIRSSKIRSDLNLRGVQCRVFNKALFRGMVRCLYGEVYAHYFGMRVVFCSCRKGCQQVRKTSPRLLGSACSDSVFWSEVGGMKVEACGGCLRNCQ